MADYDLQYQDTHIDALLATANELKTAGYIYKGVATPSTNPGTPTERVAYLASEPGTYTNFGGIVIASGLYSLTYASGTWTGTQMSAGSDIAVVQTTGQSASDVMSQKAVTDEIMTPPQSWDLSYGGDFTWELGTIHDDGKAYSSSSYYHLYIPVSDIKGGKVKIKSKSVSTQATSYAFLKDIGFGYPIQALDISSFYCVGYNNKIFIPAGEEAVLTIPNDCNYLYVNCGQTSGNSNTTPESNSYYTHKWSDVVQTMGQSTRDVMSQKAVTDELEVLGDNLIDMSVMSADSNITRYITAAKDTENNGVVFNVVTHNNSGPIARIYQMHLVEGKTYRLSFEYLNTAYQTSPSFRNSSNVYIASDISFVTMPVNNEYKTWECIFVAPANAYYLGFAGLATGAAGSSLTIKNFSCVEISSLKESIAELNDKIEKAGILGNYELYQGTIDNGQILPSTTRLYTNIIKTPCYIKARDGYHIAGIARYGDNSRNIFLGSDWDITLNERNVNDFGYCSFVITKGNSSQVITPDEDCIESFYNMLSYSGHEIVPVSKDVEILQNTNFDMPFLGYGRKVISRPTDTYTHAASVDITSDYMFISYHSSAYKTVESFVNNAITLYVLKLSDASVRYIDMFNDRSLEKIDGNVISKVYNQSVAVLNNQKILMRTGCNMDGKWQLIGRTYDVNLNELSAPFVEKLSYNGMTVDFTLSNWWSMCNTLYGTSLSDIARTDSNEIAGICRSGNYYYTVHAFYHQTNEVIPTVLLKSLDAITWEPVACLTKTHVNSETAITALNNKLYIAFRNNNNGTFYMVTDMDGNVLQDWTSTGGGISSRPSIASAGGKIYIAYNHATGNSKHFGRNGLTIAEINQTSYELTTFKTWKSNNGYNYFAITPTINQNLIIANVEDFRGYNYANNQNATTDINIAEIELL